MPRRNDSQDEGEIHDKRISRRDVLKTTAGGAGTAALAGCLGGLGGGDGGGPFKIGAVLPINTAFGRTALNATEVGISRINEVGGLDDEREVEIIAEDSELAPGPTQEKTNKLIDQDDVDILFGPLLSSSRGSMSPIAKQREIPLLYPVEYEGPAADDYCNEWVWKAGEVPVQQVQPFIPWLIENHGPEFYIFGNDYVWAQKVDDITEQAVKDNGGEVLGREYVELETTNLSSIVTRIEEADPDVLCMTLTGQSVVAMMKELEAQGVRDSLQEVGWDFGQGTISGLTPEQGQGLLSCHPYFENLQNDANAQFKQGLQDQFGEDAFINFITGTAFAQIQLFQKAAEEAGSTAVPDITDQMSDVTVENSLLGRDISYVRDQQAEHACWIGRADENMKYQPVKQLPAAMPEDTCEGF
jgi:ABC-type branched-subunit amino acid transport system substrate-binding protein